MGLNKKTFRNQYQNGQIQNKPYTYQKDKKANEAVGYSLYFAIKYKLNLINQDVYKYAENSSDCIVMLLSFLYEKRNCKKMTDPVMKKYKELADNLYADGKGMDEFWLFIYEVFTSGKFSKNSDWYQMKQQKVSFIKPGYF